MICRLSDTPVGMPPPSNPAIPTELCPYRDIMSVVKGLRKSVQSLFG